MQNFTGVSVEKQKAADDNMIVKFSNAIIDGVQKEVLKMEIRQLVVKAQYGTSTSRSLGKHSQLTFKSSHSSPTYQRSKVKHAGRDNRPS